jgi:hypothetical protein
VADDAHVCGAAQHYGRRLLTIVTHPAFCGLSVTEEGEYRLEMLTPLSEPWSATGSLAYVIDKSFDLPLDG